MANRILGLAGKGKGPRVYTGNLGQKPKAKIVNICEGEAVILHGDGFEFTIAECGVHEIPASEFVQVEYHGDKFMICTLHAG